MITLILQGFYALASLLIYPFLLLAASTIMYFNIGVYTFVAIGVIIAFILLQILLTKVHHKLRQVITKLAYETDINVQILHDCIL